MRVFFSDSIRAFQPIADLLRPDCHGVGRALLGMRTRILREVQFKTRLSHAQFELLPTTVAQI